MVVGVIMGTTAPAPVGSSIARRTRKASQEELNLVAWNSGDRLSLSSTYVNDWEFNGAGDSMPRVFIHGGVPSPKEAKEATSQLSLAIEKVLVSPPTSVVGQLVPYSSGGAAAVAMKMMIENPKAQQAVASMASDPKVWEAALENSEFQSFLKSQGAYVDSAKFDTHDESKKEKSARPKGKLINILEKIKRVVVDMIKGVYNFFVDIFEGNAPLNYPDGKSGFKEVLLQKAMIGLTMMAIVVILVLRACVGI